MQFYDSIGCGCLDHACANAKTPTTNALACSTNALTCHSATYPLLSATNTIGPVQVIAAYLAGRPVPTTLVRGALWTLWYLLVAEVQLMYRMAQQGGASHTVLSQEGLDNDISNVAKAARSLVQYVRISGQSNAIHVESMSS